MRSLWLLCFLSLITIWGLTGCGESESEDANDSKNTSRCGANEVYHGGLGVEGHCDCVDGYKRVTQGCVPDDTPSKEMGSQQPDMGTGSGGTKDLPRTLPIACWIPAGSSCDPRKPDTCEAASGQTCDLAKDANGSISIGCLPGPNTQQEGESCNPKKGPFCAHGLRCDTSDVCLRFCCDDSECGTGQKCKPVAAQVGTLGVCDKESNIPKPMCAPPGGLCQNPSQCCSGNCHSGHCH